MKKKIINLTFLVIGILFIECEIQDSYFNDNNNPPDVHQPELTGKQLVQFNEQARLASLSNVTLDDIKDNRKIQGIPHFNTVQEYFDFTSKMHLMTSEDLLDWERSQGFKSLHSHLMDTYNEIENVSNEEHFHATLQKYNSIIRLVGGELKPIIDLGPYNWFVNKNGLFSIGSTVIKETTNYTYSSINKSYRNLLSPNLDNMGPKDGIFKSRKTFVVDRIPPPDDCIVINGELVCDDDGSDGGGDTDPPKVYCGSFLETTYVKNVSGCRNDRKLHFSVFSGYAHYQLWDNYGAGLYLANYWQPRYAFDMYSYKKIGLFCNWARVKTTFEMRNYYHELPGVIWTKAFEDNDAFQTPHAASTFTGSIAYFYDNRETTNNAGEIWEYGKYVKNDQLFILENPIYYHDIHAEASSRGIGANWAVIDCTSTN